MFNKNKKYIMKESFDSNNIVVANLQYISNQVDENCYSPMVITTSQKYLFEVINEKGKNIYREIFTGFIADTETSYFNLPYVINVERLKDVILDVSNKVTKYSCLLLLDEVNKQKEKVTTRVKTNKRKK
jgi:hypothetical protein